MTYRAEGITYTHVTRAWARARPDANVARLARVLSSPHKRYYTSLCYIRCSRIIIVVFLGRYTKRSIVRKYTFTMTQMRNTYIIFPTNVRCTCGITCSRYIIYTLVYNTRFLRKHIRTRGREGVFFSCFCRFQYIYAHHARDAPLAGLTTISATPYTGWLPVRYII